MPIVNFAFGKLKNILNFVLGDHNLYCAQSTVISETLIFVVQPQTCVS
jgi:hypothetical protein